MLPDTPLHPLVVHAAVVLIPVTALAVLASLVLPRFRAWLGWGLPVLGVASAVTAFITVQLGEQLAEETTTTPILETHFTLGGPDRGAHRAAGTDDHRLVGGDLSDRADPMG